jgi:predicted SprT family Zn-dependent metalloprotease
LIRINAALVDQPLSLLEEVVCHEAAHVAVHELYRGRRRPHGAEWRELMQKAGFAPRVRMPLDRLPSRMQPNTVYEHHCPVCQAHRNARRPVRRWRCTACVGVGLPGELVITKLPLRGAA